MNKKVILDPAALPDEIEKRSFAIIDEETGGSSIFPGHTWEVARRCVHACGDTAIIHDLRIPQEALESGLAAMRRQCVIYTDTRMLAAGLVSRRMAPLGIKVIPIMDLPNLAEQAARAKCTRAKMGIKMIAQKIAGQIVAIGNAPTALIALLEELAKHSSAAPALIVGMPVGFVNAAQSKELLMASPWPHFSIRGRKGGSAMAAACVNAMGEMVKRCPLSRPPELLRNFIAKKL